MAGAETAELRTIETDVPARIDRLPWSRFHWLVVIGLGTVWILDGLEVTLVGNVASRMTEGGSGIAIDASQIGTAAAFYVAGACTGALFFGQLTDRFGRKRLFLLTLGLYLLATGATAFAFAPWYFYAARFLTGAGIGGEYAAINSAIDELIPARVRGRVDLIINGTYWLGAAAGSLAALVLLDTSIFAADLGWRLAFGIGVVLGVVILFVRRNVPESPRWLFIHGREEEAERIVDEIEHDVEEETGRELPAPGEELTVRQRKTIPFRTIASTALKLYPQRTVLGIALFVGQAFIYNAVTFDLGTLLSKYFAVAAGSVPVFYAIFAFGNFLGPVTLGRLFDTVGRKPMITLSYVGSAALLVVTALLFTGDTLTRWSFIALIGVTFFLASSGASAAYLTVSEIFPMETRALAIAFFYAIGTAVGGITGPLLFGHFIDSGDSSLVATGFFIGAAVMAVGGIVELAFGVKAEQQELERIAQPLTAADAEQEEEGAEGGAGAEGGGEEGEQPEPDPELGAARRERAAAAEQRAVAAEHRASAHEQRAGGAPDEHVQLEEALGEIAEVRARAHAARAEANEGRARLDDADADDERERAVLQERIEAAERQADAESERAAELESAGGLDAERHAARSQAALERARAARDRARAEELRGEAGARVEEEASAARAGRMREERARRQREQHEREQRIRRRLERRAQRERAGMRRYRPGPGRLASSPGMGLGPVGPVDLDREVQQLLRALAERGPTRRRDLARAVGARYWGPGVFTAAVEQALDDDAVRRAGRGWLARAGDEQQPPGAGDEPPTGGRTGGAGPEPTGGSPAGGDGAERTGGEPPAGRGG